MIWNTDLQARKGRGISHMTSKTYLGISSSRRKDLCSADSLRGVPARFSGNPSLPNGPPHYHKRFMQAR
jgi:hypothetical protein